MPVIVFATGIHTKWFCDIVMDSGRILSSKPWHEDLMPEWGITYRTPINKKIFERLVVYSSYMQKKFSIKLTRPIAGKLFGVFQHIMKWAGSEKVDMRKYSPGDSASQINRKLSAKYQELYTNIFQQEKSLSLDMFLDINYNRRGGKIANKEQVRGYAEDIVTYCQHQQITLQFFYPQQRFWGSSTLLSKSMKKNMDEIMGTLHEILDTVKKTNTRYESLLATFLASAVEKKQGPSTTGRRAIVIFSDFLAMDKESKKLLHYLRQHHILFLFQLPIDQKQGQNYTSFFLQKNITPFMVSKLGTWSDEIELLQVD